jgi:GntR family transcriptional repressor for pyruvate dehydrogenase complex
MEENIKASAVDDVVRQIRTMIRERGMGIGDVLPGEAELALLFDSSRNTVREAFRTLKAYGVAESRQKIGAVLTDQHQNAMQRLFAFAMDVSVDAFRDIQGYRRLTEMNLFDMLAERLTPELLEAMDGLNQSILASENAEQASERDFQFHALLVDAAGNRTLSETYGMLRPVIQRLMMAGKSQRLTLQTVVSEHAEIVAALRRRDRIAFSFHMDRHLDAGLQFIAEAPRATPTTNRSLPRKGRR